MTLKNENENLKKSMNCEISYDFADELKSNDEADIN